MSNEIFTEGSIIYNKWTVQNPVANVIVAHGMAEHALRYAYFAKALNNQNINVYAIHHIGHGSNIKDIKGHWEQGDYIKCVDNIDELVNIAHKEFPIIRTFVLGHSMGSFMAQSYIKRYSKNIDGLILSGSNVSNLLFKFGALAAQVIGIFSREVKPNKLLDKLSFGSFNQKFKPNRTAFDWLSRDNKVVDAYVNDDLCGFVCTTSFFREFTKNLARLDHKLYTIRYDLPIYIFSGQNDPVGDFGKGPQKLYQQYKNRCNIVDLEMKLYPEGRHEMLNELNKDEVISDTIAWIHKHL